MKDCGNAGLESKINIVVGWGGQRIKPTSSGEDISRFNQKPVVLTIM